MSVPSWYELVLLALAAWRTFRLICCDTILDRPRVWLCSRSPRRLDFLECPFCLGFWVALGWWIAFEIRPHGSLVVAAVFAISALVALVEINLGPE